jgi:hypothetical protein
MYAKPYFVYKIKVKVIMMKKCKDCGSSTRTAYIRRMTAGISTWVDIGEFCPVCGNVEVTYKSDDLAMMARTFVNKLMESPNLLYVIEYLNENDPATIDEIVDVIPELNVSVTTDDKKRALVGQLISLKMIDPVRFNDNGKLALSNLTKRVIAEMNKQRTTRPKEHEPDVSINIEDNPLYPKKKVPEVIEI